MTHVRSGVQTLALPQQPSMPVDSLVHGRSYRLIYKVPTVHRLPRETVGTFVRRGLAGTKFGGYIVLETEVRSRPFTRVRPVWLNPDFVIWIGEGGTGPMYFDRVYRPAAPMDSATDQKLGSVYRPRPRIPHARIDLEDTGEM